MIRTRCIGAIGAIVFLSPMAHAGALLPIVATPSTPTAASAPAPAEAPAVPWHRFVVGNDGAPYSIEAIELGTPLPVRARTARDSDLKLLRANEARIWPAPARSAAILSLALPRAGAMRMPG